MTKAVLKCSNFSAGRMQRVSIGLDEETIRPFQLPTSCTFIHGDELRGRRSKKNKMTL